MSQARSEGFGRKALAAILVALALAFALVGCASNQSSSSASASSEQAKFAIIHTNDTHGYDQAVQHYLEDECGGVVPDAYAQPQGRVTIKGDAS